MSGYPLYLGDSAAPSRLWKEQRQVHGSTASLFSVSLGEEQDWEPMGGAGLCPLHMPSVAVSHSRGQWRLSVEAMKDHAWVQ